MHKYFFSIVLAFGLCISVSAQKSDAALSTLYKNYLSISSALSRDDSDAASKAADEFSRHAGMVDFKVLSEGNIEALRKPAAQIADSRNIATQRKAFRALSDNMVALSGRFKLSSAPVYVQTCPMNKASWLSAYEIIANPFYGKSMLECGDVTAVRK